MKYSLISATSIFALASAGACHAYVLIPASSETNLYDLVHDHDGNVAAPAARAIAVMALQTTKIDQQEASFTGLADPSAAAGTAVPLVPLGAARGTPADEDFATQYTGTWHWNAWQKALAIGVARITPLIGTIGDGSLPGEKSGSTVFAAENSQTGFDDRSVANRSRRSTTVNAFGPSSTSTATMTITGPANIWPRAKSRFSVAVAGDVQPLPAANEPTPPGAVPPTPSYHYAPQPSPGTESNLVAASFSNAISASGTPTLAGQPIVATGNQPGTVPRRPDWLPTNQEAAIYAKLIALPIDGHVKATQTGSLLPASVSANAAASAADYVIRVLEAAPAGVSGQTVETFQFRPIKSAHGLAGAATSVIDPLRGRITAGVGPLDNSLAVP